MMDDIATEVHGDAQIIRFLSDNLLEFERIQQTSRRIDAILANCELPVIVFDFGKMKFYNSMSLGFVASKNKKIRETGKQLRLCNLSDESLWSIRGAQLDRILAIYPDVDAALAG